MSKLTIYLTLTAVVTIAAFFFIRDQRNIGSETERIKQEWENARFEVLVQKGNVSYNTCDRANGLYDFTKGTCKLPVDGGGG